MSTVADQVDWKTDPWFAEWHEPFISAEFKDWWLNYYGLPEEYNNGPDEQEEYWVRCAFAWFGWRSARELKPGENAACSTIAPRRLKQTKEETLEEALTLLRAVHDDLGKKASRGNGPGHYHEVPGHWDETYNVCAWCTLMESNPKVPELGTGARAMSFGNGLNKQLRRGKSIADHMRDAIAQAMSVFEATEYVRRKCCCARVSKKRLHELYASLLPDCTAGAEDCGGCGQLGERM